MGYKYYEENCSVCGKRKPKRDMNKLYIAYGHTSVPSPRKMCSVCDECLPKLCEFLEVNAPDDTEHRRKAPKLCHKCYKYSKSDAAFCQYCGSRIVGERSAKNDRPRKTD